MLLFYLIINCSETSDLYGKIKEGISMDSKNLRSSLEVRKFLFYKYYRIGTRLLEMGKEEKGAGFFSRLLRFKPKMKLPSNMRQLSKDIELFLYDRFVSSDISHETFLAKYDNEFTKRRMFDATESSDYQRFLKIFEKIINDENESKKEDGWASITLDDLQSNKKR